MNITIPKSIEEAKASLDGIGSLLKAKEWERAAIVFAFTSPGQPGPKGDRRETPTISFAEFARLGIVGLTDKETVADYHKAWASAIDQDKAIAVKPGDSITVPDLTWPPGTTSRRGSHGTEAEARALIARNPEVVVQAIKAVPAVADAVVAAVVDDADLANKHARMSFAKTTSGQTVDRGPGTPANIPTFEREKAVERAIAVIDDAIKDEASGDWTPGAGIAVLLFLLTRDLNERATRIVGAQPVVHAEIDEFLAANRGKE